MQVGGAQSSELLALELSDATGGEGPAAVGVGNPELGTTMGGRGHRALSYREWQESRSCQLLWLVLGLSLSPHGARASVVPPLTAPLFLVNITDRLEASVNFCLLPATCP